MPGKVFWCQEWGVGTRIRVLMTGNDVCTRNCFLIAGRILNDRKGYRER